MSTPTTSVCPVCMETPTDHQLVNLPCAHKVCATCMFQFRKLVCPVCREPLFPHVVHTHKLYVIREPETYSSDSESMSILTIYDPLDSDSYTSMSTSFDSNDDDQSVDEGGAVVECEPDTHVGTREGG